jgi:exonuclease SbcC
MIPQSIKLKGFLCYKDEQQIDFDGNTTLWMLSGLNGSGKSAIFDAVTFALFGHHRGGGQQNLELINKESDRLSVEFDFLLDRVSYRARRTVRRKANNSAEVDQQIYRREVVNHNGKWEAIPGTDKKRDGFDPWVREHLGLTYETFTSSVLLLQGKADKLLDSRPEGRREVLASIVDLERYERLHKHADERRKALEAELKTLGHHLATRPRVEPSELTAAQERIAGAEAAREEVRREVQRLQGLEFQAQAWMELRARLNQTRERWQQAQRLLGDATAIENDLKRLEELREVLPRMQVIAQQRRDINTAEEQTKELNRQKQKLVEQLAQRDTALNQARDRRAALQKLIAGEEARQKDVVARFRESTRLREKLREYERQDGELTRLRRELAELPGDPAADVEKARQDYERVTNLSAVVSQLMRFRDRREELRQAHVQAQRAQEHAQQIRARGEQLAAEVKTVKPQLDEAGRATQAGATRETEARTLFSQAKESLDELNQLDGAKICRHCGQGLTAGHVKEEKKRRTTEVNAARKRLDQAQDAHGTARLEEQRLREGFEQTDRSYQDARQDYREAQAEQRQARQTINRLQGECAQDFADLPETFRQRVSADPTLDWPTTTFPTQEDLATLRAEANGLAAARQLLQKAENVHHKWHQLKAQETPACQSVQRLKSELPPDHAALIQDHTRLEVDEQALQKTLESKRREITETDSDLDRLGKDREQTQTQQVKVAGQLHEQEITQQVARQTIEATQKLLPASWLPAIDRVGMREIFEWEKERSGLEQKQTDKRGQELRQARLNLVVMQQDVAGLEEQEQQYPAEARQEPAAVRVLLDQARTVEKGREKEVGDAGQEKALLESRLQERTRIEQQFLDKEKALAADRLLADLLGRERLQLFLVRQAERQVVEYANAVLDRLSGGQLYLRLSGQADGEGSSAKALELEAYNRGTGEKPINVAFLSGSQKFRVAVSLALGIGQYASRQHRPIESVIIDEGFGCLDRQGRQVMIQELLNLRSQMRCILLVSHQEDIAEAFSDGYHFELTNGATQVRRIQR